jgi:glycerol-3-phosphate acyltransferase PlsY
VAALLAVAAYLVGSVSFARIVGRRVLPDADLSETTLELPGEATIAYGGVSATSVGVRTGPRWGIVVGVADMAKAFVPTLVTRLVWPDDSYHLVVAVAVMVGHNYPIYHRFRGGRGQSPLYGGLLAVDWLALPATTVVGVGVGLFVVRDMFVAYTLGQWLLVPWFAWRSGPPEIAYAVAVNLLFTIASIPEARRYLAKRRAGELEQVGIWRDFRNSHPAMGTGRGARASGDDTDPGATS